MSPVSSNGPHFTSPNAMSTRPQTSVMPRDKRKNWRASVLCPRSFAKSSTLEAANELSEPLALDMATATIDARSRPASPTGISRTRKSGRMRSVLSPGASRGECCAKT